MIPAIGGVDLSALVLLLILQIGLMVLGVLNNGLDHIQIDSFLKILIRGLILLTALVINVYAQKLRESARE